MSNYFTLDDIEAQKISKKTLEFELITDIDVDKKRCYETFPCRHHTVIYFERNGSKYSLNKMLDGRTICHIYQILTKKVPEHFKIYTGSSDMCMEITYDEVDLIEPEIDIVHSNGCNPECEHRASVDKLLLIISYLEERIENLQKEKWMTKQL